MRLLVFLFMSIITFLNNITVTTSTRQIFGHMIRVQRHVKDHLHNHRTHSHHSERKNGDEKLSKCPPPMSRLPADACTVDPCQSDSNCTKHGKRCCYNGCLYACVDVVHPPPLIDWQTQTMDTKVKGNIPDLQSAEYEGNIEFEIIPGEMLAESHRGGLLGEICSTTVEEDDILMDCPHGYICHIEDRGDPTQGVPNRGLCVKVDENVLPHIAFLEEDYFY